MISSCLYIYIVFKKLQSPHADPVGVVLQAPCLFVDIILKIVSSIAVEDVADYSSRLASGVV
jgi:hypothetical protein